MKWLIGILLVWTSAPVLAETQVPSPLLQCPTPSEPPTVDPGPTVELPEVGPIPAPRPQPPKPRVPVLPKDQEVSSIGVPLLDRALRGEEPSSVLPFWFGYPWAKIETPRLWTAYLADQLRTEARWLLRFEPKDAELFCPNYRRLNEEERMAFWIRLISAIIEQESTYNPTRYYHSIRVEWGLFSTGLMMLSLPSATQSRFGCSMIQSQDDLFRWRNNLDCALKIMTYYMSEDQVIASHTGAPSGRWMGLARYWEPFRDSRLKSEAQRELLMRYVKQNRLDWLAEGQGEVHPAKRDGVHKAAGEKPFGRILRITNQMAICPSGSPDDYEEKQPLPEMIHIPIPTPRPDYPGPVIKPEPPPVVPPGCPSPTR